MTAPSRPKYVDLHDWKKDPSKDVVLRKSYTVEIEKSAGLGDRQVGVTISTNRVDRDKDTVSVDGWVLEDYLKNPVVLWGHDYKSLPIGRAIDVSIKGKGSKAKLYSVTEFTDAGMNPMGDMVYRMVKGGFINATSVGFLPEEWTVAEERMGEYDWWPPYDFTKQHLLEYSWVPVPSNADALVEARSAGIDVSPLKSWAEQILDEWHQQEGLWVSRRELEKMHSVLDNGRKSFSLANPPEKDTATKPVPGVKGDERTTMHVKLEFDSNIDHIVALAREAAELTSKAGRTLSAANETALSDAKAALETALSKLSDVLNQVSADGEQADDGKSAGGVQKDVEFDGDDIIIDGEVFDLDEATEELSLEGIDLEDLKTMISHSVATALGRID